MAKHPVEVFGYPTDVTSTQAMAARERYWCPFADQECNKKSRLITYPMGVCSVLYGDKAIAICPRRFLQDSTVFRDVADLYFNTRSDLLLFSEIGLRGVGTFDYVMVKHKPLSSDIEDFVMIEFQTAQTTGTGKLVEGLKDFMKGKDVKGKNYRFGLNLADIWKRSFTQILVKGVVLEHWGSKIYWVVQEPVYQDLLDRYKLHGMTYKPDHSIVFTIYDLKRAEHEYKLFRTRVESSAIDDLFKAFRHNLDIPSKNAFIEKLRQKLRARMELKLQLD